MDFARGTCVVFNLNLDLVDLSFKPATCGWESETYDITRKKRCKETDGSSRRWPIISIAEARRVIDNGDGAGSAAGRVGFPSRFLKMLEAEIPISSTKKYNPSARTSAPTAHPVPRKKHRKPRTHPIAAHHSQEMRGAVRMGPEICREKGLKFSRLWRVVAFFGTGRMCGTIVTDEQIRNLGLDRQMDVRSCRAGRIDACESASKPTAAAPAIRARAPSPKPAAQLGSTPAKLLRNAGKSQNTRPKTPGLSENWTSKPTGRFYKFGSVGPCGEIGIS
ncbi:hypothetical protein DFH09DRAFT_1080809 [Mycena vulgaris]|nr:hypothetical protein DFH09DRAFT_1080809 [Mycena vulgaris]